MTERFWRDPSQHPEPVGGGGNAAVGGPPMLQRLQGSWAEQWEQPWLRPLSALFLSSLGPLEFFLRRAQGAAILLKEDEMGIRQAPTDWLCA